MPKWKKKRGGEPKQHSSIMTDFFKIITITVTKYHPYLAQFGQASHYYSTSGTS